jgi:hypothetical protein
VLYEDYELKSSTKWAQEVKLLTYIREITGFNISWIADYPGRGFSWFFSSSPGKCRYITSRFLPRPFQFIIH